MTIEELVATVASLTARVTELEAWRDEEIERQRIAAVAAHNEACRIAEAGWSGGDMG